MSILVFIEHKDCVLNKTSLEAIAAAQAIAKDLGIAVAEHLRLLCLERHVNLFDHRCRSESFDTRRDLRNRLAFSGHDAFERSVADLRDAGLDSH